MEAIQTLLDHARQLQVTTPARHSVALGSEQPEPVRHSVDPDGVAGPGLLLPLERHQYLEGLHDALAGLDEGSEGMAAPTTKDARAFMIHNRCSGRFASPYEGKVIMKRIGVLGVGFLVALVCLVSLSPCRAQAPPANLLKADEARKLLPRAASMSPAEFQSLAANPAPDTIKNRSLTLVLLSPATEMETKKNPAAAQDFRYLGDGPVNMVRLAKALAPSRTDEYASFLRPEHLTACTCESADGRATGTINFRSRNLFEGKVRFSAVKTDKGWSINEFVLPNYKLRVFLNKEGRWEQEALKK